MLRKTNRVSTKEEELIFKKGGFFNSPSLTLKYFKNDDKRVKISFIAPKNVAKLAVKRNLLRRRGYTALEKHIKEHPLGVTGVFVFRKYQDDILILSDEIKNILSKIN